MKFVKVVTCHILIYLFTIGSAVAEIIPRVGINAGNYYLEEFLSGGVAEDEFVVGPKVGVLTTFGDNFLDLSFETYSFSLDSDVDIDRSEFAGTYGFLIRETMYGIIGYQYAAFGDGVFDSDFGESYGPFAGVSVNNLRMGQDSTNVFSLGFAVQLQETEIQGLSDSELSMNIRAGFRKAGEPHGFSAKFQTFGSDFHSEYITMLSYNYQFAAF